jgi:TonB family protein
MNLRHLLLAALAAIGLAGCTAPGAGGLKPIENTGPADSDDTHAFKPDPADVPYSADLGAKPTDWGVLHCFDRMRPARTAPPEYPIAERHEGITGSVVLIALVNDDGSVADVRVLKTSGRRRFDEAAVIAVRRWKYHPLAPRERFVTIQPVAFDLQ